MRISEKKIKAKFTIAHKQADALSKGLEDLEEAICNGNYPEASERFGVVLRLVNDHLQDTIEEDIAGLCDAINPEIIAENERGVTVERVKSDLNGIGSALVVLKDAVQHTRPRKQGNTLDDVELCDQVEFIDDLKWKVWNAADALENPKHRDRVLSEMEEIRSQLGVLANGYDVNSDADRSILCERLRSTAERVYVSFKTLSEDEGQS